MECSSSNVGGLKTTRSIVSWTWQMISKDLASQDEAVKQKETLVKEVGCLRGELLQELKGNIRVFCRVRPLLPDDGAGTKTPVVSYPTSMESQDRRIELIQSGGRDLINYQVPGKDKIAVNPERFLNLHILFITPILEGILCFILPHIEINIVQSPPGNIGNPIDIEFMDPAILAVGKGRLPGGLNNAASLDMRSNFSSQLSAFENEARLQLLMQRSLSPPQNQRYADMGVGFAQLNDAYRIPSRIMEQSLPNNLSPFSQLALQQPRTALMANGQ
ncbi:Kinesin-like protein KIN-14C [Camellia lanceoleosa]|uniref:Kinesin-like protein KIN-14C n=1 Tax=Camellia lanceoleosa TaxID=1840588 RepID=A0ACC0FNM9_9ERIC|nr:Kinesin-like protein KIN-14C [Camellia lanceoleosa]